MMVIRNLVHIIGCVICFGVTIHAQLPTTNIYHFKMTKVSNQYRVSSPQFLTQFNNSGYNNQPTFFEDEVVYFTTDYYDKEQTEIAKFDFYEESLTRITYTPEKEYSPTKLPNAEGFSVVRVEDDDKTQTLSIYPLDGIGYPKRYMNNTSNIGYHAWLEGNYVALFLVEEPNHNLAIADAISERRRIIIDKVGRCLKKNNLGEVLFVHKQHEDQWFIKSYNQSTKKSTQIIETLKGAEDFEILVDGTILMGEGATLYKYTPGKDNDWKKMSDLEQYGITSIQRICARKNSLIVVNGN